MRSTQRWARHEPGPALADLGQYLLLRPRDAQALTLRAGIWMAVGEAERALADWNAVLELDADDPTAQLNRGQVLIKLERCEEARRDLDKLIAARPELPEAYYFRAACRERLGDTAGAAADLEQTLQAVGDAALRAQFEERIVRLRAG